MEWVVLVMPIIERMIQKCQERNAYRGNRRRRMGNLMIRRAIRQAGVPRSERDEVFEDISAQFAAMGEAEIDEFIEDACAA